MANNGILQNGVCVHVAAADDINSCPAGSAIIGYYYNSDGSIYDRYCYSAQMVAWKGFPTSDIARNCQIEGPPLTEQQQIEAINGLFPYAVAIIAVAWGFKFIRGLIENWLRDRNSDD